MVPVGGDLAPQRVAHHAVTVPSALGVCNDAPPPIAPERAEGRHSWRVTPLGVVSFGQLLRPRALNRDAPSRITPAATIPIAASSHVSGMVVPVLGKVMTMP